MNKYFKDKSIKKYKKLQIQNFNKTPLQVTFLS